REMKARKFDAVIDMICFNARQAESAVRAFAGRCDHYIFCSTVCTYGAQIPSSVLIDETFPQNPISQYGREKLACEDILMRSHEAGAALGKKPQVLFMPAAWIIAQDAARFGLLREITQFHGAYTSEKARRDVPEFHCEIEFARGANETFADVRRRNAWKSSAD